MGGKSSGRFVLGTLCSALLLAAVSAVVGLSIGTAAGPAEPSIDLVRSVESESGPGWKIQPIGAEATTLFFASGKGPRADVEFEPPQDAFPTHTELASLETDAQAFEPSAAGPARLRDLTSLARPAQRAREQVCLAETIYHEGRGQPVEAALGVGQTVINRALSGAYPNTLCDVIQQRSATSGACQYAFVCDNLTGIAKEPADWALAQQLAAQLLGGNGWQADLGDATHTHSITEHPPWAAKLQRVKRLGGLVFYRGNFAVAGTAASPLH